MKRMNCILCAQRSDDFLFIFEDEGIVPNLNEIIRKHFWLQPNANDINASAICPSCLDKISTFHVFYLEVEEAHARLQNIITTEQLELWAEIKLEPEEIVEPISSYRIVEIPNTIEQHSKVISTTDYSYIGESQAQSISDQNCPTNDKTNFNNETSSLCTYKKLRNLPAENIMDERDELIAKYIKLTCETCFLEFPKFSYLQRHYVSAHKKRSGYAVCCNIRMYKRCQLIDHIKRHQNPNLFKCELCERVLSNRRNLNVHMRTHTLTDRERNYHCDKCDLSFHTERLLKRHWHTHVPGSNVQCPQCSKFYSTEFLLWRHIGGVHNQMSRSCDVCGMSFKRVRALRVHKLEHTEIFEKYHQQPMEDTTQEIDVDTTSACRDPS